MYFQIQNKFFQLKAADCYLTEVEETSSFIIDCSLYILQIPITDVW